MNYRRTVFACSILLLIAGLPAAHAKLKLTLRTDHETYIEFEPVVAFLTIENDSKNAFLVRPNDQTLRNRVYFEVEHSNNRLPQRTSDGPMVESCLVLSGEKQEVMSEVSSHYKMGTAGGYNIWAIVEWDGVRYESNRVMIKAETGLPLATERRTMTAGGEDSNRRFMLRYLNREGSESIFFCADDPEQRVNYGVFELGKLLRFFKPRMEIDPSGAITVYHQASPNVYVKSSLQSTRNGMRLLDQRYQSEQRKGSLSYTEPSSQPGAKSEKRGWWHFGRD